MNLDISRIALKFSLLSFSVFANISKNTANWNKKKATKKMQRATERNEGNLWL